MSLINLEKKVAIVLEKRGLIHPPPTKVGMWIDGSGSMTSLYQRGVVQNTVDRCLAVSSKFDDDGNLDMWMFDHDSHPLSQATPADYNGYVRKHIMARFKLNGGTALRPVLDDTMGFYYSQATPAVAAKPGFLSRMLRGSQPTAEVPQRGLDPTPVFILAVTDGENVDAGDALRGLKAAARFNIYFQFVGIGDEDFRFLKTAASDLPNVGFAAVRDIANISDEDLFERILPVEFIEWVRKHGVSA